MELWEKIKAWWSGTNKAVAVQPWLPDANAPSPSALELMARRRRALLKEGLPLPEGRSSYRDKRENDAIPGAPSMHFPYSDAQQRRRAQSVRRNWRAGRDEATRGSSATSADSLLNPMHPFSPISPLHPLANRPQASQFDAHDSSGAGGSDASSACSRDSGGSSHSSSSSDASSCSGSD